jgi:hypothetical protein
MPKRALVVTKVKTGRRLKRNQLIAVICMKKKSSLSADSVAFPFFLEKKNLTFNSLVLFQHQPPRDPL